MKKFILTLIVLNCGFIFAAPVVTNQALLHTVSTWQIEFENGEYRSVYSELKNAENENGSLDSPVLKGENWALPLGLYVHLFNAQTLTKLKKKPDAWQSLMHAYAFMPETTPPATHAEPYWQFWTQLGYLNSSFGRYMDADYYLNKVVESAPANTTEYSKALGYLAHVKNRTGRLDESLQLYNKLFSLNSRQPTPVWHDYCQTLFDSGLYEQGVATIIRGARANGISAKYLERDYFLVDACRYWHHFNDLDILDWYTTLGDLLKRVPMVKGNEQLFALLINSRTLIKKVYPELIVQFEKDVTVLKDRLKIEIAEAGKNSLRLSKSTVSKPENRLLPPAQGNYHPAKSYSGMSSNMLAESRVNEILFSMMRRSDNSLYNSYFQWKKILDDFSTNLLAQIRIDGTTARALTYSGMGVAADYMGEDKQALDWFSRAEGLSESFGNPNRAADMLLRHGRMYMYGELADTNSALYYFEWARTVAPSDVHLQIDLLNNLAWLSLHTGGPAARIPHLQAIIDRYGDCVPINVYQRLARDYFSLNKFSDGFNTLFDGKKRTRVKMLGGRFDSMIDGMMSYQSFLSAEELTRFKDLVRTCVLRFPASRKMSQIHATLFNIAQADWINRQIKLAHIESSACITPDDLLLLSNQLASTPSVRAGWLHFKAQLAAGASATNTFNWSGWKRAIETVRSETCSSRLFNNAPINAQGACCDILMQLMIDNWTTIPPVTRGEMTAYLAQHSGCMPKKNVNALSAFLLEEGITNSYFTQTNTLITHSTTSL